MLELCHLKVTPFTFRVAFLDRGDKCSMFRVVSHGNFDGISFIVSIFIHFYCNYDDS